VGSAADGANAHPFWPSVERYGDEQVYGRLKPGLRADITAFAQDPVDTDPDELPDLPVELTIRRWCRRVRDRVKMNGCAEIPTACSECRTARRTPSSSRPTGG
jgi:hypothetical protein